MKVALAVPRARACRANVLLRTRTAVPKRAPRSPTTDPNVVSSLPTPDLYGGVHDGHRRPFVSTKGPSVVTTSAPDW